MKTKQFIYESMVDYLKKCYSGAYGQLKTIDVYSVFKDRTEEVIDYLQKTNMIKVATYGGAYGSYKAIAELCDINDEKLRALCEEAWMNNADRKRSLNNW